MKPILCPLYLSLFLLLIREWRSSAHRPIDDITLNCGSSVEQLNEYDSRTWSGDINSKLSPIEAAGRGNTISQSRKAPPSSSSASQVPYTTARLSYSEFTYKIPLSPGQKFIRLYFNPATYNPDFDRSNSLFSVKASGSFTFLKDFNASVTAEVDEPLETFMREFCVNIDPELQSLNITFTPTKHAYAFINGIEIVSMPANLYYTAPQSQGIRYLNGAANYHIENTTALEMVYRINVGGSPLSPNKDTGMYRNWEANDDVYLDNLSKRYSVIPSNSSIKLKFDVIPEYAAPDEVYQTARTMGPNLTINRSYNLTWVFPVDPNFQYFIRLHFCEFQNEVTEAGDRKFLIHIANLTAEENADIIRWSLGNGIPVFRDYVVYISGPKTKQKVNLYLVLQADPSGWAWVKYNDAILNGLEIFKLNYSNGNLAGLNPDPPYMSQPIVKQKSPMHSKNKSIPVIAAVVSTALVLCLLGFLVFRRERRVKDSTKSTKSRGSSLPSDLCRHFSFAEIKDATQNFNDIFIIGVGGFGNVYKGYVDGGFTPVAIKRLKPESSQGAHEFKAEIEMLSQLRHLHLVSLVGYCTDQGEMILVYDYVARGTLRDHLYNTENPPLSWEQRLQICIGTAQGLQYLHEGTKCTIIHRDVKSTNILLDEKWVAKVSDFGLSKMGNITMSKTHISTMVKGSFGYLDPEYYRRQQLTEKSDVYSFGVVLCEILCGRPAVTTVENDRVGLAKWAKKCHGNGKLDQIIDPNLKGKIATRCLLKYISIAMSCMDDNGVNRPSMKNVVGGLEFAQQLQLKNEEYDHCMESFFQDETTLIKGNDGSFCNEQSSGANESIPRLTGTIFSEIIDPVGR
ncbi:hypothetical protein M0R45_033244 [Rubus argutus]|uniref:Protein kinase domain-containing protein n=1 Tax=Rubus argutus TaxID=59490 RepID=A0AAW1WNG7_RUBAR